MNRFLNLSLAVSHVCSFHEGEETPSVTPPADKTFTQEQVNALVAKERRSLETKLQQQLGDAKTTAEQKQLLESQLEELRSASMTEKEKAAQAQEKLKTDYENQVKTTSTERDAWKSRYTSALIDNSLISASTSHEAFNARQIQAILGPSARVVETIDAEGKPTGQFGVKVKVKTVNQKKEAIELDLTPDEAVKTIKEMPEFANLFKGKQVHGLGDQSGSGQGSGKPDLKNMTHEQYMEFRKKNPSAVGL